MANVPMVTECKECGNILEAPLMRGSKACCVEAVKDLCMHHLRKVAREHGHEFTTEELLPYRQFVDMVIDEGEEDDGE